MPVKHRGTAQPHKRVPSHRYLRLLVIVFLVSTLGIVGCEPAGPVALEEPGPFGGPALLRRLTESQYRETIADIFGPDAPILARFERGLRSHGLVAVGTSTAGISTFSIEQYDNAAVGVAEFILSDEQRGSYVPCTPLPADTASMDNACAVTFVRHYGLQLLRRPLTDDQVARYVSAVEDGTAYLGSFYKGLKFALVGMMTSPQFLLRLERSEPDPEHAELRRLDPYSMATRLSYFLTNSSPDQALLAAVASGDLNTPQGLASQVDRLMGLPGYTSAMRAFFSDMLEFEMFDDLTKDGEIYPAFTNEVAVHAQEQTLRDIEQHLIVRRGDYRDLFTLDKTHMSRVLGLIYRQPVRSKNGWNIVPMSREGDRLGIQSHISFLALHAHPGRSSPTLRGEAIRNVFLCQEVPEPPADIDFSVVQNPSRDYMPTARDRLAAHNNAPACKGCHKVMDPVGLALENFDGIGTYRSHEFDASIDASGVLDGTVYADAEGLAKALREHPETPRCLVERMTRYALGRDIVWDERAYLDYLIERFAAHDYRVPDLMRTIAISDNFFAISPITAELAWTGFESGDDMPETIRSDSL